MTTLALLRFTPLLPKPAPAGAAAGAGAAHLLLSNPLSIIQFPLRSQTSARRPTISASAAVPATDRLISVLAYSLPFLNSLHYGRFLFARVPIAAAAVGPLLPLVAAYRTLPYAGFVAFFALYLGVVRNPAFGNFVRFNSMQAVVLDVLLALPVLLQRIFGVPARGLGFKVLEIGYDVVFVFAAVCFVYSVVSCLLGRTPYLPIVATAADRQL